MLVEVEVVVVGDLGRRMQFLRESRRGIVGFIKIEVRETRGQCRRLRHFEVTVKWVRLHMAESVCVVKDPSSDKAPLAVGRAIGISHEEAIASVIPRHLPSNLVSLQVLGTSLQIPVILQLTDRKGDFRAFLQM